MLSQNERAALSAFDGGPGRAGATLPLRLFEGTSLANRTRPHDLLDGQKLDSH